ncbi:MAG: dTMP kinase [Gemmatimonadaceae bacterium]
MSRPAGKLIVLEGPEGAGKTTQAPLLAEWLRGLGYDVVAAREPGGTPVGDEVRRILLDSSDGAVADAAEALLYMASRAQLVERVVRPALARGAIVLLDRFFLSTYAYQIAGRGLVEEEVRAANQLAVGHLVPDLTILLTIPPAEGLARADRRGGRDRLERADSAFHERVARAFASYADPGWQRAHPECGPVAPVDARGDVRDVFDRVADLVRRRWPESFPGDLRQSS